MQISLSGMQEKKCSYPRNWWVYLSDISCSEHGLHNEGISGRIAKTYSNHAIKCSNSLG